MVSIGSIEGSGLAARSEGSSRFFRVAMLASNVLVITSLAHSPWTVVMASGFADDFLRCCKSVSDVAEFTVTVMDLFGKYKSISIIQNEEMQRHLTIMTVQQGIIKQQSKQIEAANALLLEHEQRINKIAERLDQGQTHNNAKLKQEPH